MNGGSTTEINDADGRAESYVTAPSGETPEKTMRLLHVDDDADLLKIVKNVLEFHVPSLTVESVTFAAKALKLLERHNYDCILSDYKMPGMNGIELARRVKQKSDIPFIIYTGQGSEKVAAVAFESGVDDYLRKERDSGHYQVLAKRITTAIEKRHAEIARRQAEAALIKSEKIYRSLVEMAPDGIMTLDLKGYVRSANSAFFKLTGFAEEEIVGKHFSKLQTVRLSLIPSYVKMFVKILRGKSSGPLDLVYRNRDGIERWGEAHASLVEVDEKEKLVIAIMRDVTDRKKQQEKLAVMSRLTRHDIRNKLSVITSSLYLANMNLKDGDDIEESLDMIGDACDNIVKIVEFATNYEKLGSDKKKGVNVSETFKSALNMFDLGDLQVEDDCEGFIVQADSLLKSILYNLVDNTLRHGRDVSRIRLSVERGGRQIVYQDDGVGMPPEERGAFNGEIDEASTHGLALIKRIIESYGWTMREKGRPGGGVRFVMALPDLKGAKKIMRS
jgi:PAS domain S-box-containing protein